MGVYCLNVLRNNIPAADGQVESILEPLPLRGLFITIRGAAVAANTAPSVSGLTTMITNIELLLGGTTIWQTSLRDACNLMSMLVGRNPQAVLNASADNTLAQLRCYIPLGSAWGSGTWFLPATPAGQLRLRLTVDIAVTAYDGLEIDVDAIHDDSATPAGHYRVTTLSRTAPATGDMDIDLPIGRWLSGVALVQTTYRSTQAGATGITRAKILRDSVEIRYPSIEMSTALLIQQMRGGDWRSWGIHTHESDLAAAYTQFQRTAGNTDGSLDSTNCGYLDFDPAGDGSGLLDLRNCNRLVARLTMGTAEAVRLLAIEWWPNTAGSQAMLPSG